MEAQTKYPLKIQAIRAKGRKPTLYVYVPIPLAAAIDLQPGEEVQWELLDRTELHLVRTNPAPPRTRRRAAKQSHAVETPPKTTARSSPHRDSARQPSRRESPSRV